MTLRWSSIHSLIENERATARKAKKIEAVAIFSVQRTIAIALKLQKNQGFLLLRTLIWFLMRDNCADPTNHLLLSQKPNRTDIN
jgi:hypothetical protein